MWYNPIVQWLLRSPLHFFVSKNLMLMTYTGRKSGKSYTTPMNYLKIGDALYTISSRERVWWRNLRNGAEVILRLRGEEVLAQARAIEAPEDVADNLILYLETAPQLARYINVRLDSDGRPNSDDIARLAREKVMVQTRVK